MFAEWQKIYFFHNDINKWEKKIKKEDLLTKHVFYYLQLYNLRDVWKLSEYFKISL